MDAGIQSQGRGALILLQGLQQPEICHPWALDFGIHAEMTG
jgi:hypothetical protein